MVIHIVVSISHTATVITVTGSRKPIQNGLAGNFLVTGKMKICILNDRKGFYMKLLINGAMDQLQGNWTLPEMTERNINSLVVSLDQAGSGCEKNLMIDCKHIEKIDASGLQLLFIWLHCFRLLGVEPELVNLADDLQKSLQVVGFRVCC